MDWLCSLLLLLGYYLTGRHLWYGWVVQFLSNLPWLYLVVEHEMWGFLPSTVILAALQGYYAIRWRQEQQPCASGSPRR